MSDDIDLEKAARELHEAENELRKAAGENPKEYVPYEPPYCSFCGKSKNEVSEMIEGPSVFICDICVAKCQEILNNKKTKE